MSTLAELMFSPMPDDATAAQQRNWVTYTPLAQTSSISDKEPELKLLENRAVISGAGTTGLRTWEAALHLSSYLLSSPELIASVKGKKVIELGAGTGLLSILCASHLEAAHVTATDGDEGVVQALHENAAFNDVKDAMDIGVLWWGRALKGSWMFEKDPSVSCDLVLGADVVSYMFYDITKTH
jgi:predicted nicotinamide N-methyase